MKKKKFLSLAMAAVMTAAMSLSALAAEVKINSSSFTPYGNLGNSELQDKDGLGRDQAGLGPAKPIEDNKDTSGWEATLDVDVEGDYTLKFCYTGAASELAVRKFAYQIDNGDRVDVDLEITDSWKTADAKVKEVSGVHLTAGTHKIKMGASTDFNDEKTAGGVKTPNIIYVAYEAENQSAGTNDPEVDPVTPAEPTDVKEVYALPTPVTVDGDTATSETIDNPLKNVTGTPDAIVVEASISSTVKSAAWQVMFGFIKDGTNGFVDFCRWPMIQLNQYTDPNVYANFTTGNGNILADSDDITDGTPNVFKWVIRKTGVTLSVDGVNQPIIVDKDGAIDKSDALYNELCTALFNWVMSADKVEFGNAAGDDANWWGEHACTINSLKISVSGDVQVPGTTTPDNPSAGTDDPDVDNPSAGTDDPNVDPANPGDETGDGNTTDPATGDKAPIVPFAIAGVLAVVVMGCVVVLKKRNA